MSEVIEVQQAKEAHKAEILAKPNVVGVGVGYKVRGPEQAPELSVVTLVRQKIAVDGLHPDDLVPRRVNGVPTDVVEVGELRAFQDRRQRWRPAPGGVSIGHYRISAGTLGVVVRDRLTGTRLILSNNHVLANSNDAEPGDAILQPGGADGGKVATDTIAHLERFIPIRFNVEGGQCNLAAGYVHLGNAIAALLGSSHRLESYHLSPQATNLVDAAVARPVNDADVLDEILEIGEVAGTVAGELGMPVRKSGRTTGFTTGEIIAIEATVNVNFGVGRIATFEGQFIAGPMSQGGDSGSLVVAGDSQQAVGLLFAGSPQTTIFSPIESVLNLLEVEL
jgi:hypothetical protein